MGKKVALEIIRRITGFSTPVFGISWEPPQLERDEAQKLLTLLEDQRLLLGNYDFLLEHPHYVNEALYRLRNELTSRLENLDRSSPLAESISVMRAACRKCLDSIQQADPYFDRYYPYRDRDDLHAYRSIGWIAIGELRATFGFHIAQLCVRYRLEVEEELKSILPLLDDKNNKEETDAAQSGP